MYEPLTHEQAVLILGTTMARIDEINQILKTDLPYIKVTFDVSGHTWGYYSRRGTEKRIRYNPAMFAKHMDEGLNDTVPHEVAHYIVDMIWDGKGRPKPHGGLWHDIMGLFGIEEPQITHNTDVSGIPARRQRTHRYLCSCREHQLSTTRHNRVQRNKMNYRCRDCGEVLRYGG